MYMCVCVWVFKFLYICIKITPFCGLSSRVSFYSTVFWVFEKSQCQIFQKKEDFNQKQKPTKPLNSIKHYDNRFELFVE